MSDVCKSAYQYRLHLTKGQQRLLEQQLEECRFVYNQTLAARRDAWEQRRETLGLYDTQALLPDWKAERRSLKLVHSQVLQNVQLRVDLAFKVFFHRVKAGEQEVGYPRFKGYGRYDSMTYRQYGNGARLEGDQLILSKIGARIHERITNRRKNFAHQESRKLVKRFGTIVFEDLSITRMMGNHCLAKSIADAAWGQLASYTQYKAEEAGAVYIEIDPRGTSQRCSRCGAVVKKSLSVRVHQCPYCGLEIDRDLNAAYNILRGE